MEIRQENTDDYKAVFAVNELAFGQVDEGELVDRVRKGNCFIPELSLVAVADGQIVGHILFSKIEIKNGAEFESLALAPMAVLPEFQKTGIGGKLIVEGLRIAKALGHESVIVLGHKEYYPKFGFKKASTWGITCPLDVPDEYFMAIEFVAGTLSGKAGTVVYPPEFEL